MIHAVRPYQIFQLLEGDPIERVVQISLPRRRAGGTLTLLETALLLSVLRSLDARSIFEFGTYLGGTTLNLALNAPPEAEIFTFDLDEASATSNTPHAADAPLVRTHLANRATLDYAGTNVARKIREVKGNSLSYSFSDLRGKIDLVFIDGGHDLATVTADTENAFGMLSSQRPSAIAWHDYRNAEYPELTTYLDGLAGNRQLFCVGDTMLCFYFKDALLAQRVLSTTDPLL